MPSHTGLGDILLCQSAVWRVEAARDRGRGPFRPSGDCCEPEQRRPRATVAQVCHLLATTSPLDDDGMLLQLLYKTAFGHGFLELPPIQNLMR